MAISKNSNPDTIAIIVLVKVKKFGDSPNLFYDSYRHLKLP